MANLKKLFGKEHPFLGEPGEWVVLGHGMYGEQLIRVPIEGKAVISHRKGKIINEGTMSVVSSTEPVTFSSRYELSLTDNPEILSFFQVNEELGDMRGQVIVFDDRLISFYSSGDETVTGSEVFLKLGENRYTVTGGLYSAGFVVNLWKLDMVRQTKEEKPESAPGDEMKAPDESSSGGS
jgi:hypothetical protein